jgi:DNA-binding CsgD family transcriptional regulator
MPFEAIGEIYDAVGDAGRWKRLMDRLAATRLTPEIAFHLEIARQAHERHMRLEADVAALARVHELLALGALVVDQDCQILRANGLATGMLANDTGLVLAGAGVKATEPRDDVALRAAVARAALPEHSRRAAFLLVTRPGSTPLSILVLPPDAAVLRFFEHRCPVVLLLVDSALDAAPGEHVLRALFAFTAREAECAALLMRGHSINETACALGVSRSTVRTYVAQMTAKTCTHGQTELVGRLLAIPRVG